MCITFVYNTQQDDTEMVLHTILITDSYPEGKEWWSLVGLESCGSPSLQHGYMGRSQAPTRRRWGGVVGGSRLGVSGRIPLHHSVLSKTKITSLKSQLMAGT